MRELATLITGANGEIGHGLITALQKKKSLKIVVIDINKLDDSISRHCNKEITGDILDLDLMNKLNDEYEFETIYHLAALLSTRAELSPQIAHDVNVGGTMNLLNLAYKQGLSQGTQIKFFFPSSIAIYGLKNIVKEPTCFKNDENPSLIDLILTNKPKSFQNTVNVESGLSDFHKMTITVKKCEYKKTTAKGYFI